MEGALGSKRVEQVIVYEKVITWLRHVIGVENVNSRQEAIDKVINCYKLKDPWSEDDMIVLDTEELCDAEEPMSVEENKGYSTIEIIDKPGQVVWGNGKVC